MSTRAKADDGVNRLLDIVVEEVSLVDRAANKHRFLIVKRSDDMDENTNGAAAATADETEDIQDLAAEVEAEGTDGGDPGEAASEAEGGSVFAVALEALEGLTEAVELLGATTKDKAQPRLAELAGELRTVSERLAGMAGVASADSDTASAGGERDKAPDGDPLAAAIATVRATLERVSGLVDAGAARPDPSDGAEKQPAATDAALSTEPPAGPSSQFGELTTALRTLTDSVREQQQRLARLEKRFGLPNSAPSGERTLKAEDQDVGWPMDLNRPFDRESVDKATSFHDV